MRNLKNIPIRKRLMIIAFSVLAFVALIFVITTVVVNSIKIGGKHYYNITMTKDLVSDVSPSEGYVIKAYAYAYMYLTNENVLTRFNAEKEIQAMREAYEA